MEFLLSHCKNFLHPCASKPKVVGGKNFSAKDTMSDGKVFPFIYFLDEILGEIPLPNLHKTQESGRNRILANMQRKKKKFWIPSIYCDCAKKCSVAINYCWKRVERSKNDVFWESLCKSFLGELRLFFFSWWVTFCQEWRLYELGKRNVNN